MVHDVQQKDVKVCFLLCEWNISVYTLQTGGVFLIEEKACQVSYLFVS